MLLVQAYETAPGTPWTADDRALATRLARETTSADASPTRYLDERARHALHLLAPRDKSVTRVLAHRLWRPAWVLLALALGASIGFAIDALGGGGQRIDLLAPGLWPVVAWNLLVYLVLLLPAGVWPPRLRKVLAWRIGRPGAGSGPLAGYAAAWARHGAPLALARAALLLHLAAAALAAGMIAGLYLRGLALDYRAGWQSTFLVADNVRVILSALLAPAVALTGIAVPDPAGIEALRIVPPAVATASAAPWIHLFATTLAIFVLLPRLALALWAAGRARWLARRFPLPLDEPYFQRLLREHRGGTPQLQVLPHGAAPSAQAALGLRALLEQVFGPGLKLSVAAATAYGDEDAVAGLAPAAGTTQRLVLVDLATTPEDDTHGRFLRALRAAEPALPLLLLADESGFRRRFAATPERLAERRLAWRALAESQGAAWVGVALEGPDAAAADELEAALAR